MNEAARNPPEGGYPKEIFRGNFDSKLICNSCNQILREPVQSYCGHRFCKVCIEKVTSSGNQIQCQSCIQEGVEDETFSMLRKDQLFPDNALRREMNSMEARCTNKGCDWIGKFKGYEDHSKECRYRPVVCVQCNSLIEVSRMKIHLENDCPNRNTKCKHCQEMVIFAQIQEHQKNCPKFPVKCDLCGKKKLTREMLENHKENECMNHKLACPAGCDPIERHRFISHLDQRPGFHVQWLLADVLHLKQELDRFSVQVTSTGEVIQLQEKIKELQKAVGQHEQKIQQSLHQRGDVPTVDGDMDSNGMRTRFHAVELKTSTFEGIVTTLHKEIERCIKCLENMERTHSKYQEMLNASNVKVINLERQLGSKDVIIAELKQKLKDMDDVSYTGEMIWRIENWSKLRQDALSGIKTSIYSPPFYTHRNGYKMCVRFYPNGDGMGKSTHVSVFFVMMKGKYDALLEWPFRHRITFAILDQVGSDDIMDSFRPDPSSNSFKRPVSEMNIASGCPLFMKHSSFESPNNHYLRDDVIFLRTNVAVQNGSPESRPGGKQ